MERNMIIAMLGTMTEPPTALPKLHRTGVAPTPEPRSHSRLRRVPVAALPFGLIGANRSICGLNAKSQPGRRTLAKRSRYGPATRRMIES
jgi:hypothetical protein